MWKGRYYSSEGDLNNFIIFMMKNIILIQFFLIKINTVRNFGDIEQKTQILDWIKIKLKTLNKKLKTFKHFN